jgi:hypothetical protein
MRRGKEPIRPDQSDRLWNHAFGARMLDADARAAVLASVPPADLLATFLWLFPDAEVSAERRALWRFNLATLQAHDGDLAAARTGLRSLVGELQAKGEVGRLLDEAQRGLDRSGGSRSGRAAPVSKSAN